jgi:hypothetical protein
LALAAVGNQLRAKKDANDAQPAGRNEFADTGAI